MKKSFLLLTYISLIFGLIFTSCEPTRHVIATDPRIDILEKDNAKTHGQLVECNAQLKTLSDQKTSLQNELDLVQNDLKALSSESKMTIAEQAKRLRNLQGMIQSQKDKMTNLKNSITDALMNYNTDELNIYIKDGNVYVSLEEKLLFKSGSDVVDAKGKEALKSLAKVLNTTKGITVMIEGHTDKIPIKTKQYEDNWDLSTARATSIVRILTKDYDFDSNRITASGRGAYHPIKTNETTLGRASNRRTEVILSPDLKELYTLLDQ
ncbi:MAG: flagellar motor protein MotB [Bacteroidales bacterium]|nr:MAG: flagellar motor protein MotB [Bacteroidales bacterium]